MADRTVVAGSDVSAPQLMDLFRQISDGSIRHHHVQAFLEHRNPFEPHLRRFSEVVLPGRSGPFHPSQYFIDGNEIFLGIGVAEYIFAAAFPVASFSSTTVVCYELVRVATDEEIRHVLSEGHVFEDANIFCAHLAILIDRQKNGEGGDLLTNGHANIFYVQGVAGEVFAVYVRWHAAYRGWRVRARRLGAYRWLAGCRVFSGNCERLAA